MEMLAATVILGLLVSMAVPYFGHDTIANARARGLARKMSLDALQAQRRAISTGVNHYLKFTKNGSNVTAYALYRRDGGGDVRVDEVHEIPSSLTVTSSADDFEFNFSGEALASYTSVITSPDLSYTVLITAATGKAFVY